MPNKIPRRYRQDIQNLMDANLLSGNVISMTLQEFGRYCERDQLKIAAYAGLSKYLLRQYGISLFLTSRKTKVNSGNPPKTNDHECLNVKKGDTSMVKSL